MIFKSQYSFFKSKLSIRILLLSLILNFFSFLEANEDLIKIAINKDLQNTKEWKALLHIRNGKPQIKSKDFLLSTNNFSLKNELILTINSFKEYSNICKYPARYYFFT
jgi:hypothetical protein